MGVDRVNAVQHVGHRRGMPARGWNSWDSYGTTVTEEEVLANATFLAEHLLVHGWDTVVVDIQWYEPAARSGGYNETPRLVLDRWGRPLPAPNRFPSAAKGDGLVHWPNGSMGSACASACT